MFAGISEEACAFRLLMKHGRNDAVRRFTCMRELSSWPDESVLMAMQVLLAKGALMVEDPTDADYTLGWARKRFAATTNAGQDASSCRRLIELIINQSKSDPSSSPATGNSETGMHDSSASSSGSHWGDSPAADVRAVMQHVLRYARDQQRRMVSHHSHCATAALAAAAGMGPQMRDVVHWMLAIAARVDGLDLRQLRRQRARRKRLKPPASTDVSAVITTSQATQSASQAGLALSSGRGCQAGAACVADADACKSQSEITASTSPEPLVLEPPAGNKHDPRVRRPSISQVDTAVFVDHPPDASLGVAEPGKEHLLSPSSHRDVSLSSMDTLDSEQLPSPFGGQHRGGRGFNGGYIDSPRPPLIPPSNGKRGGGFNAYVEQLVSGGASLQSEILGNGKAAQHSKQKGTSEEACSTEEEQVACSNGNCGATVGNGADRVGTAQTEEPARDLGETEGHSNGVEAGLEQQGNGVKAGAEGGTQDQGDGVGKGSGNVSCCADGAEGTVAAVPSADRGSGDCSAPAADTGEPECPSTAAAADTEEEEHDDIPQLAFVNPFIAMQQQYVQQAAAPTSALAHSGTGVSLAAHAHHHHHQPLDGCSLLDLGPIPGHDEDNVLDGSRWLDFLDPELDPDVDEDEEVWVVEEEEDGPVHECEGDTERWVLNPLAEAAAAGDRYVVELLLEVHGADPAAYGGLAERVARAHGHALIAKVIYEKALSQAAARGQALDVQEGADNKVQAAPGLIPEGHDFEYVTLGDWLKSIMPRWPGGLRSLWGGGPQGARSETRGSGARGKRSHAMRYVHLGMAVAGTATLGYLVYSSMKAMPRESAAASAGGNGMGSSPSGTAGAATVSQPMPAPCMAEFPAPQSAAPQQ